MVPVSVTVDPATMVQFGYTVSVPDTFKTPEIDTPLVTAVTLPGTLRFLTVVLIRSTVLPLPLNVKPPVPALNFREPPIVRVPKTVIVEPLTLYVPPLIN